MSDYKALPQSEEIETLLEPAPVYGTVQGKTHYSKLARIVAFTLLMINTTLLVANGVVGNSISTSLANVLPAHDPRTLPRPDQYAGLPQRSRNKTVVLRDEDGNLVYPDERKKRSAVPMRGPYRA